MLGDTVNIPVDPLIGSTINGYLIQSRLGEGGMGVVYRGEQVDIGKRVAIKVLKPDDAQNRAVTTRLVAEARAVNAIRHRGIVDIFGYAKLSDGRQCILMEFLEGEPLEAMIKRHAHDRRTVPLTEVLRISDEVLVALGAAHAAGVVHRDLKPSNIFLCTQPNGDRHVKLLDFGVAKMNAFDQTHASAVLGTPLYMAPEQAQGEAVTPAIDLYAFGVILFELLTGQLPFSGENAVRVIYQHIQMPPPVPSSLVPTLPAALDAIVLKLLAKKPRDRHANVEEIRGELTRLKAALADPSALPTLDAPVAPIAPAAPVPEALAQTTASPRRRSTGSLVLIGLAAAALAAVGVAFATSPTRAVPEPVVAAPPPPPPPPKPVAPIEVEAAPAPPEPSLTPPPPPPPSPAPPVRAAAVDPLTRRIDALDKKVARLREAGDDVDLYQRQLEKLRQGLRNASRDTRAQIELAVTSLEEDLR